VDAYAGVIVVGTKPKTRTSIKATEISLLRKLFFTITI
jgi:hypothetical protein